MDEKDIRRAAAGDRGKSVEQMSLEEQMWHLEHGDVPYPGNDNYVNNGSAPDKDDVYNSTKPEDIYVNNDANLKTDVSFDAISGDEDYVNQEAQSETGNNSENGNVENFYVNQEGGVDSLNSADTVGAELADQNGDQNYVNELNSQPSPAPQQPYPQQPKSEPFVKGNSKPVLAFSAILFVLMIGLSIFVALHLSENIQTAQKSDKTYETDSDDPFKEIFGDKDKDEDEEAKEKEDQDEKDSGKKHSWFGNNDEKEEDEDDFTGELPDRREDEGSEQANPGKDSEGQASAKDFLPWDDTSWKEYTNHDASEFAGKEYYEDFGDCINNDLNYQVDRKFYEEKDEKKGLLLRSSYIALKGDIPNLDKINDKLKEYGLYYQNYYLDNEEQIKGSLKNADQVFWVDTKSFVTYNDEDTVSVLIQDEIVYGRGKSFYLTSVNINLITGAILDNSQMVDLPDDFGAEFRERSVRQNGDSAATDYYSDEQILQLLRTPDKQIIFYTPVGLEIGFEYENEQSSGWLTISLRDYEKLLKAV
ncbi:MAG: hypothetical protein K5739_03045 [Lachnospiraceae bacterium]|nr:hypothetical protein [Lachnospiraceae bacterium]